MTTLCLSGGGFRATIFHAGLIAALREMQLLERTQSIVSVSGGSIAAAHLVLNWDRYTNYKDDVFRGVVRELLAIATRDVRGRIVRRWVLFGCLPRYRRLPQLIRHYDNLYHSTKLEDLDGKNGKERPKLFIASTSLVTGVPVYFSSDGLHYGLATESARIVRMPHLPVAHAVAASSAFPPMFPPLVLDPRNLQAELHTTERLTDAGVFDNLGIVAGKKLAGDRPLLVSDASASFSGNSWNIYKSTVGRTVRTTDILMSRVAELDKTDASIARETLFMAAISDSISDQELRKLGVHIDSFAQLAISKTLQHWVRLVRTDLDKFSDDEIKAIFRHGYTIAIKAFAPLAKKNNLILLENSAWDPTSNTTTMTDMLANLRAARARLNEQISQSFGGPVAPTAQTPERSEQALKQASTRRLRLWNSEDPLCWATSVALALVLAGVAYGALLLRTAGG